MNARWTKMIIFSVFCVLLSLEFGVATPQGNRLKESNTQNENDNEINIERNVGERSKQIKMPINQKEFVPEENVLMHDEGYGKNIANNPAAFRNFNEQSYVISEKKENNQITPERNLNNVHDDSPSSSYIGSLPQVHQYQTFRPKDGVNNGAKIPKLGDILSEVNNTNNDFSKIESNPTIIRERIPSNQIINTYNTQYSQVPKNLSDKKEEENGTQFDVPVATPEYIQSLLNEDKQTQNISVKSMITNLPRNDINNKSLQPISQNVNEATSQNPSAEILYETGQAKPYEITKEQLFNSRHGNKHAPNILNDKQRLKNLYLSSKPTKHYMIVYPDGRVEEVDKLDKIKKMHPNYVMLNAKELLQQGEAEQKVSTGLQGSIVKQNVNTTATVKPQSNFIKDTRDDQMDKVPQKVDKQSLPVPIELLTGATESNIRSTSEVITKTNNVAKTSEDEVLIKLNTDSNIQKQLQENGINDNQDKNKLNNNENANWGSIVTTSNTSNIPVTELKDFEDTATTVRSTKSIAIEDSEILNQNISKSLASSNNTDKPEPEPEPKEQPNINSTSSSNLINTNYEKVVDDTNNSSVVLDSYREEDSSTKLNNDTMVTFEDGKDSDGKTETIITKSNYESNAQNLKSNNVTSSDGSMMFVRASNNSDIANSSSDYLQENVQPLNVNSSDSSINNALDFQEKDESHVNTTIIQNVRNVTNSEVDRSKTDDNNFKPNGTDVFSDSTYINGSFYYTPDETYDVSNGQDESNLNKTLTANIKQEGSKYSDDVTDDSESIPVGSPDVSNYEDSKTATDASNNNNVISLDGAVPSNKEDTITTPDTALSDLYYLNSPQKQEIEDDEEDLDDEDEDEIRPETANANDNLEIVSPSNDGNGVNESSFWFNANDSFWNKLMNSNEHNSFYFLFPRPKPKETKKTIYPNGTIVIETTEDDDDGEINLSKTELKCGNFTICEKKIVH